MIKILDEHIANQIAAGEVIERPVSVVKELVENAIDAKATRVSVSIQQGGLEQIKVTDNGYGMSSDDVRLSFERHATSKIINAKNLFRISTLGFRGEALPSIAAISKVEIRTKRVADANGSYLLIEGGKKQKFEPVGCPNGTQVIINDIFYNTPARLKYLKTITTETNHINDYLTKISMAYPEISFSYQHNGKQIFFTRGSSNLKDVLLNIYGNHTHKYWIPIKAENLDFQISGYIAKPEFNRASRQYMVFYVNGRYIRSVKLSEAILKAYHTLLPINKYPITVIKIDMDYSLVDVNVHPSKLEVRFSKETELFDFLFTTIQKKLQEINLISDVIAPIKKQHHISNNQQLRLENQPNNFSYQLNKNNKSITNEPINIDKVMQVHEYLLPQEHNLQPYIQPEIQPEIQDEILNNEYVRNNDISDTKTKDRIVARVIGQIHGTYIVAENENGMLLIDQHAAHERINYEKIMNKVINQQIKKQDILIPIQLRYTNAEIAILIGKKEILDTMAIEIEKFGEQTIIVRTHPDWITDDKIFDYTTYIIETLLHHNKQVNTIDLLEESVIKFSCKSSIKANMRLSKEEMERLVDDLNETSFPYTCPHGRPVVILYSNYELEKLFKRKN